MDFVIGAAGIYWCSYVALRVVFPYWYPRVFIPLDFLCEELW